MLTKIKNFLLGIRTGEDRTLEMDPVGSWTLDNNWCHIDSTDYRTNAHVSASGCAKLGYFSNDNDSSIIVRRRWDNDKQKTIIWDWFYAITKHPQASYLKDNYINSNWEHNNTNRNYRIDEFKASITYWSTIPGTGISNEEELEITRKFHSRMDADAWLDAMVNLHDLNEIFEHIDMMPESAESDRP